MRAPSRSTASAIWPLFAVVTAPASEAALKLKDQLKLKKGDYVAIKGSGGIFAMFSKEDTRKTGTVTKVEFDGKGKVIVDVKMLPFDNVEQFNGDQVEAIQK